MRSFIIFGFLAATASAGVLPGYKYGPGVSGVRQEVSHFNGSSGNLLGQGSSYGSSGLISSGSGIVSSSSGSGLFSSGGYGSSSGSGLVSSGGYGSSSGSGLVSSGGYGSSSGSGFISSGGYGSSGSSGNYKQSGNTLNIDFNAINSVPQTVEHSKQFYHFEAPEEVHEEGKITRQLSNVLKKNLQVVFIKAPENNAATNAALQLAKQAIEQRTAIYVLTKQADGAQLIGQLQQIQENVQTAPEVKFVKYRTAEDVQRAKAEIQSQYDNFGGAAENFDGGVAPVLNYASAGKQSQINFGASDIAFGSNYGSGSKIASAQLVSGGNNYQSGSNLGSASTQLIGLGSLGSSSNNYQSGSSLGSASAQLVGLGSLGSSSNVGSVSYTSGSSYLPPLSAKK